MYFMLVGRVDARRRSHIEWFHYEGFCLLSDRVAVGMAIDELATANEQVVALYKRPAPGDPMDPIFIAFTGLPCLPVSMALQQLDPDSLPQHLMDLWCKPDGDQAGDLPEVPLSPTPMPAEIVIFEQAVKEMLG